MNSTKKNNLFRILIVCGACLATGVWFATSNRESNRDTATPDAVINQPEKALATPDARAMPHPQVPIQDPAPLASKTPASDSTPPQSETKPADKNIGSAVREGIFDSIQTAVTSYNETALLAIEPYLTHSDPAVREAARNGFIQVGDAAGAKLLRQAAEKIKDPREAVRLLDAADYLELPPAAAPLPKKPGGKR